MKCEYCHKEHDGSYGSGRFCSERCSRKFSSETIDKNKTKEVKCKKCGKIFIGKYNAFDNYQMCEECKKIKKCLICGREYIGNSCKNIFCQNTTIKRIKAIVKFFNIDCNLIGTPNIEKIILDKKKEIEKMYFDDKLPVYKIGEIFKMKYPNNMSKIFNFLNIKKRNRKDTALNFIYNGGNIPISNKPTKYKNGNHITWEGKIVYLRSSFEKDFAKELDNKKIKYLVEFLRILYFDENLKKERCAIPDFYLPDSNTIVEIKSSWTLNLLEMKSKIKKYKELGFNFKLIYNKKETDIEDININETNGIKKKYLKKENKLPYIGWIWINNGKISKKCLKDDFEGLQKIGWKKGRIFKNNNL